MKDIFYFILGAAIGAIFALLFAPQSGEALRSKIQDTAEKDWTEVQAQWQTEQANVRERLDQIQQTLQEQATKRRAVYLPSAC